MITSGFTPARQLVVKNTPLSAINGLNGNIEELNTNHIHDNSMDVNSKFFTKYRDYILFNKNLLISGTCALLAGALVAQLYSTFDHSAATNSLVSLVTEYSIYIPLFAYLFYRDNMYRYIEPSGKTDRKKILSDIRKLLAAFSISEIIYSVTRGYVHYQILVSGTEPYQASILASLIAWTVFSLCINFSVKLVRLFKKNTRQN